MSSHDEIARHLKEAARSQRPYAGFFDWPDRTVQERGVAKAFLDAAANEPGLPLRDLVSRNPGQDPPDCEAIDGDGRRIAIEITELVEGQAIAAARRGDSFVWVAWTREDFLMRVQSLLVAKDSKELHGGPYREYWVVIFSDEAGLPSELVEEWLCNHSFHPPKQVNRAYLLLSYDPRRESYPLVRLRW